MVSIVYTDHLKLRLNIRKIPFGYPRKIYQKPELRYYDTIENTEIAIRKLYYNQKIRNMAIVYEKKGDNIEIITIHPISEEKLLNRIINRRWVKDE
ncbi:hypothetical protein J4206_07545 [Candidatus Woesearchaeota archaeon]|nr:hypothetical protein [Candidatus Woesearchaeota archaeon]